MRIVTRWQSIEIDFLYLKHWVEMVKFHATSEVKQYFQLLRLVFTITMVKRLMSVLLGSLCRKSEFKSQVGQNLTKYRLNSLVESDQKTL